MLLDLKAPLAKDTTVPVKLTFKDAKGVESTQELTLPVATSAPGHACHARSRCCGPRAWPRRCQALKSPWGLGDATPHRRCGGALRGTPIASGHGLE